MRQSPTYLIRPTELPSHQRNLAAWWLGDVGKRYANGFIRSSNDNYDYRSVLGGPRGPSTAVDDPEYTKHKGLFHPNVTGTDLVKQEAQRVLTSTPYWISEEMMAVAEHAMTTMPELTFREEHMPTADGFMYLQAPRYTVDSRNKRVGERLIVWNVAWAKSSRPLSVPKPGAAISWYSGRDDPDDDYADLHNLQDRLERIDRGLPPFVLLHVGFWPFGDFGWGGETLLASGAKINLEEHPEYDWRRFLASTWQLLQQTIARTTRIPPDRYERKRMIRAKQPQHEVRVITLRREKPLADADRLGEEHVPVNWQRRWIVRGHWRKLHHMTADGREVTWVSPYVKGPEDKPLVFSKDVYKLVR